MNWAVRRLAQNRFWATSDSHDFDTGSTAGMFMETPISIVGLLIILAGGALTIFKLRNVPIAFKSVLVQDVKYKSFGYYGGGVQTTTYDMNTVRRHSATVGEFLRWPVLHGASLFFTTILSGPFVALAALGAFVDPWSIFLPIFVVVGVYGMFMLLISYGNIHRYRELVVCRDRGWPFNYLDQNGLKGVTIVPESQWPSFVKKLDWPGAFDDVFGKM